MKTFEEITDLCDNLFANGHIRTMKDAIINFDKYMDDIEFNFFDYGETKDLMDTILTKLKKFDTELDSVLNLIPYITDLPISSKHIIRQDFLSVSLQVRYIFEAKNFFTTKNFFLLILNIFFSIFRVEIGIENEEKEKKEKKLAKKK